MKKNLNNYYVYAMFFFFYVVVVVMFSCVCCVDIVSPHRLAIYTHAIASVKKNAKGELFQCNRHKNRGQSKRMK